MTGLYQRPAPRTDRMTRREFYARIGLLHDVDSLTQAAYNFIAIRNQLRPDIGAAARDLWHLSFHGSQFPGDDPYACGRRAIYRMMDIPRPIPPRWLEQIADAGKDIEDRVVQKWYDSGYLLSNPPYDHLGKKQEQTQFEDPEVWLTSTVDAIVLFPTSAVGRVVEVKSKWADDIEEMFKLYRGPDPQHVKQVKTQIAMAREFGEWEVLRCYNSGRLAVKVAVGDQGNVVEFCPEHGHAECLRTEVIEPVEAGTIYYVSRDHPADTWEFYYDYDPDFMEAGRNKLAKWKASWLRNELPQTEFSDKRFSHPFGWFWSKDEYPCKWCDYGDLCREDHKLAVTKGEPINLHESTAIEAAKEVRVNYDLDLVRTAIEKRWEPGEQQD